MQVELSDKVVLIHTQQLPDFKALINASNFTDVELAAAIGESSTRTIERLRAGKQRFPRFETAVALLGVLQPALTCVDAKPDDAL